MILVPARMRRLNQRSLIARLQRLGVASRAELAKAIGMSQPTAGKIADELLRSGLVEEVDGSGAAAARASAPPGGAARLGRPGRMLRLTRSKPRFLAIQLGVSHTQLAALPVGVEAEDHWPVQVPTSANARDWVRQLRRAAASIGQRNFWGVLVSVPGIVDEAVGRVLFSPNLHWTERADLPQLVRQVWKAPVHLVQEERALASGHQYVDPEREDFLLVDFGEGVGGAVVVAGRLSASPLPISGELGHTPVPGNQRPCGCGANGCVETLVSTRGLLLSLSKAQGRSCRSWDTLCRRVAEGGVEPWLAAALDAAAVAIAGALNVIGLRHVVVTGTLAELPSAVMDYLSGAIQRGALWARFGKVEVEAAPRRRTAGLVAVGIDRLVLPMTDRNRHTATDRSLI